MSDLFAAFGINWKLLLIQAVNFGLLLSVLTYFLYRPILRIIDERQRKIAEGVATAQAAQKQLADAKEESESIVGAAARDAETLAATARAGANERAVEIVKAAEARADAVLKDANARAEEAKRQTLKESEREIARAAVLAAEKILREKSA
jgi:F-type H+-transporting ATPase subunit b